MDDKLYMVLVLGVIFVSILLVREIKDRKNAKARQKYYSDFMWHFNKANTEHQKLCIAAQYYIENDYVLLNDPPKMVHRSTIVDSIKVTSTTADKTEQIAKETRIRENGGNYVKLKNGNIVEIPENITTRIERRD